MRPDKLAAYLDVGTVSVFARQIVDTVNGISSVALHDPDGRLLWAGPDDDAARAWPSAEFLRLETPPEGYKVRYEGDTVHVFPLGADGNDGHVATLSLRFSAVTPANHGMSGRISDIAVDPNDRSVWYVAVGSGGIFKTVNAGTTWEPIFEDEDSYSIGCITIDPNDSNVIWVGSGENISGRHAGYGSGIYRSADGGENWVNMINTPF